MSFRVPVSNFARKQIIQDRFKILTNVLKFFKYNISIEEHLIIWVVKNTNMLPNLNIACEKKKKIVCFVLYFSKITIKRTSSVSVGRVSWCLCIFRCWQNQYTVLIRFELIKYFERYCDDKFCTFLLLYVCKRTIRATYSG